MEQLKKQITDLLWSHATKAHGAGSCGELGDSFMAIDADSFSDISDELLQNFEPKKCMQLPLAELKDILITIESVEENQILGNHKKVRRLIFKAMFDLRGVIAAIA